MRSEEFAKRSPVDATAAAVVGKPGSRFQYQPEIDPWLVHSEVPIPTRPPSRTDLVSEGFQDLAGTRIDRLVVLGLCRDERGWVARCDCGRFTRRSGAAIKRAIRDPGKADIHACEECQDLNRLKNKDYFNRHQKWER